MEAKANLISITEVPGLRSASGSLGIKRDHRPDAALFALAQPATYAGVFTTNRFRSACVESSLERLHAGKKIQSVLITSGNANAGTGLKGRADTEMLAASVAQELGCQADEVIVLHTGVIGVPLGTERLLPAIPKLVGQLDADAESGLAATRAMMTTDTFPKAAMRKVTIGGISGTIGGVAKGAGMIHPRLATMLSVIVTDFAVRSVALQAALEKAVKTTFNAISVDGDTSPNDSVILLATGEADAKEPDGSGVYEGERGISIGDPEFEEFCATLTAVCEDLAKLIVRDGEGASKFIEIEVRGAATEQDAERIACTIATSPLVKTAFFGEDFNPGRIVSAIGRAGAVLDLSKLSVEIGQLTVFSEGEFLAVDEHAARAVMAQSDIVVSVALHAGEANFRYFTCDLTYDYVRINAEYTT